MSDWVILVFHFMSQHSHVQFIQFIHWKTSAQDLHFYYCCSQLHSLAMALSCWRLWSHLFARHFMSASAPPTVMESFSWLQETWTSASWNSIQDEFKWGFMITFFRLRFYNLAIRHNNLHLLIQMDLYIDAFRSCLYCVSYVLSALTDV